MNKLEGKELVNTAIRVVETGSNSRLPKLPLLDPNLLKQRLLLTPLIPGALVFFGYIPDLLLPVATLQARHQRDKTRGAVISGCEFCTGPLSRVRMAEILH